MFLFQVLGPATQQKGAAGAKPVGPAKPVAVESKQIVAEDIKTNPQTADAVFNELNKFINDQKNVGKTVIVYFSANDCKPCKELDPKMETLSKSLDGNKFAYVKVDLSKVYTDDPADTEVNNVKRDSLALIMNRLESGRYQTIPVVLKYNVSNRTEPQMVQGKMANVPISRSAENPSMSRFNPDDQALEEFKR